VILVSVGLRARKRATALTALIFPSIGAAFVVIKYVTQTKFVPALVGTDNSELRPLITMLSMFNPQLSSYLAR